MNEEQEKRGPGLQRTGLGVFASVIAKPFRRRACSPDAKRIRLAIGPQQYPTFSALLAAVEACPQCRDYWEKTTPFGLLESALSRWRAEDRREVKWPQISQHLRECETQPPILQCSDNVSCYVVQTPNFKQCIPQAAANKRRFVGDGARRAAGDTAVELSRCTRDVRSLLGRVFPCHCKLRRRRLDWRAEARIRARPGPRGMRGNTWSGRPSGGRPLTGLPAAK